MSLTEGGMTEDHASQLGLAKPEARRMNNWINQVRTAVGGVPHSVAMEPSSDEEIIAALRMAMGRGVPEA
jgi:hypothetical protein